MFVHCCEGVGLELMCGLFVAYKFPKAQERLEELKKGGTKAQKNREKLSRNDKVKNEADCAMM